MEQLNEQAQTFRHHLSPVSIIVAVDSAGGFGKDGKIPWNVPEDMKHFRERTKGAVCIMGRKTYEDMLEMWHDRRKARIEKEQAEIDDPLAEPKEILPGRECFVVTSNPDLHCPGATAVPSMTDAIQRLAEDDVRPTFILGGYHLWVEALGRGSTVYMTTIRGEAYQCDRTFPIEVLNKHYTIVEGRETDNCWYSTYAPRQF